MFFNKFTDEAVRPVLDVMKKSQPQGRIERARARLAIRRAKRAAERPPQEPAAPAPAQEAPMNYADGGYVGPRRSPQDYGKKKK